MPPVLSAIFILFAALAAGCPAPPTAIARGEQVAQDFNQDARFGHTELMVDHVAAAARDDFAAQHRGWGGSVRLADLEVTAMRPRGDRDLTVIVRVAWYRPDEQELRVTTLEQTWREISGWQLTSEKRIDGDVGLLGEAVVRDTPREPAQFPTIRLGHGTSPAP